MKNLFLMLLCMFLICNASTVLGQTRVEPAKPQKLTVATGKNNAITDVSGVEVGHYERSNTGTTVVLVRNGPVGGWTSAVAPPARE